jgi:2-polyprenyl-3-methyl-5-hydroxy-6-metoxy-1,4-benzoquinol methylase
LPAEGEGRNAVYAASNRFQVSAYDWSEAACAKAAKLAEQHQVKLDYQVCSLRDLTYPQATFDALAMVYVHFPEPIRTSNMKQLLALLKPGGSFIFEAFSESHPRYQAVNPEVGGPKEASFLYNLADLKTHLTGYHFEYEAQEETVLNEGAFHKGLAEVVRIHAIKP